MKNATPKHNTETRVCEDCGKPIDRALMEIKASYDHMDSLKGLRNVGETPDWRVGLSPGLVKDVERAVKYPTPRSDKAIEKCCAKQSGADLVVGEFSRVLERELAEAQEENQRLRDALEGLLEDAITVTPLRNSAAVDKAAKILNNP